MLGWWVSLPFFFGPYKPSSDILPCVTPRPNAIRRGTLSAYVFHDFVLCVRIIPTTDCGRSNGLEAPEHHTPCAAHQLPAERDHGVRVGGGGRPLPVSVRGAGATRRGRGREGVVSAGGAIAVTLALSLSLSRNAAETGS